LAEGAPSGGVLRWVAGRPADGVLLPAVAGGRRPPAGCAGAAGGGVHLRRAGEGGTGRRRRTRGSFGPRSGAGRGEKAAEQVVAARSERPFADLADLTRRVRLSAAQLEALATAGAL